MSPKAKKTLKDTATAVNGISDNLPSSTSQSKPVSGPGRGREVPSPTSTPSKPASGPGRGQEESPVKAMIGTTKPDQAAYHAEQDTIKSDIDALQVKLAAVKEKISLMSKNGASNDRRTALRAELDSLRGQRSTSKMSRGKLLEQIKSIQDGIQKKVKDLQAAKAKAQYKTIAEVEAQVKHLEKQVESGNLKLGDEKRALQEISSLKRSRRTVESFQSDQNAIEADRARSEELRKQLDDPEAKALSERYDVIRAELEELKKDSDEAYADRSKLFDERNALSAEIDAQYLRKRESAQRFREASDRYWQKVNEDRARRAERLKAQRAAEEEQKRKDIVERLLEEAKVPAFQAKIEDCQTLIDYFSARVAGGSTPVPPPPLLSTSELSVSGLPKLDLRQVTQDIDKGLVARKKKGEEQEAYFIGGKGKAKKGTKSSNASGASATSSGSTLNIPLPTLTALLELSIPPPSSTSDLPRAVEDLKTKKAWFEANQSRITAENVAKAQAQAQRLTGEGNQVDPPVSVAAPNGKDGNASKPPSNGNGSSIELVSESAAEKVESMQNEDTVDGVVDVAVI